ncbi:CBS domain-containing protein [Roseospira navarrensis]|uniref:CBS domain-containing protein n=1 Tax=Roseospira navarrensis TaxID=140058 RepID=A0A7X2D1C4_9PROT|nr:CBS domain-containing protein [Roseospira navarrensis]MQX34989.1 CBS domain-containing protein [Roseospira navarrensis]
MKRLKEIMSPGLATTTPTTSLKKAAGQMDTQSLGLLAVADDDTLVGTLTDRDIVVHAVRHGLDVNNTPVRDAMTAGVTTANHEDSVADAARLMADEQVRRLLVENDQKEVVGAVSIGDLATHGADSDTVAAAMRGVAAF